MKKNYTYNSWFIEKDQTKKREMMKYLTNKYKKNDDDVKAIHQKIKELSKQLEKDYLIKILGIMEDNNW